MVTVTMKLPESLAARLEQEAERRKTTKSALVRHCLEVVLMQPEGPRSPSFHDLARDKCGRFRGPRNLATDPKHMRDFGQ